MQLVQVALVFEERFDILEAGEISVELENFGGGRISYYDLICGVYQ